MYICCTVFIYVLFHPCLSLGQDVDVNKFCKWSKCLFSEQEHAALEECFTMKRAILALNHSTENDSRG